MTFEPTQVPARPIVLLGGGGKTGRRIAERLRALGVPFRAASRSTAPAFDWNDQAGWPAALEGAGALYVSYQPDLGLPGGAETVDALAWLAAAKGIQKLVLLSGRGEEGAQRAETALKAAVKDWTVLRCSWFNQNFSENFLLDGVMAGELVLPASDIPEPFVDAHDIADVAVAALTGPGHERKIYELTGPRAITFAEAARILSNGIGREVRFTNVPLPAFLDSLKAQRLPDDVLLLMQMLFGEVLDGRNVAVQDGIERVLGRPPRSFEEYVALTAVSGAWRLAA